MIQAWWFRFLVRTALALLAFWALWFAQDRFSTFSVRFARPFLGTSDNSLWLLSVAATIGAGLLFGLAAWLPFTEYRYLPSRLLLAAAALVPVAHFWLILLDHHVGPGWLGRLYWFDMSVETEFVLAALGGVAIASGFRAKDEISGHMDEPSEDSPESWPA